MIVQKLAEMVIRPAQAGYTIVMVEQNFRFAAPLADRFYVMEHGRSSEFSAAELPARKMPARTTCWASERRQTALSLSTHGEQP